MTAGRTQTLAENRVRNWRAVVGQIPRSLVVLAELMLLAKKCQNTRIADMCEPQNGNETNQL